MTEPNVTQPAAPATREAPQHAPAPSRLPPQVEWGHRLESKDLDAMEKHARRWMRAKRAPIAWSTCALLIAILRGANWKNSRYYRSARTLAFDAGLGVVGKRPSRTYAHALLELVTLGVVERTQLPPRDPSLERCHHRLKARGCRCAWNHGKRTLTVLAHNLDELLERAAALVAIRGEVLVRAPRLPAAPRVPEVQRDFDAPGTSSSSGANSSVRCTSLSVSTSVLKKGPKSSPTLRPTATRAPQSASPPASIDDSPSASGRARVVEPTQPHAASASTPESLGEGRARRVPNAHATAHRLVLEHRARTGAIGAPTWREIPVMVGALERGWPVGELREAIRGAMVSPLNVGRRRQAGWIFADDTRIDSLVNVAREHDARRASSAAAGAHVADVANVPILSLEALVDEARRAELEDAIRRHDAALTAFREALGNTSAMALAQHEVDVAAAEITRLRTARGEVTP